MSTARFSAFLCLTFACTAATAADLPGAAADGWHTWRVDVVEAAPELCCFAWNRGVATKKQCKLDGRHGGFRSANDSPFPADEVQIYALMSAGSATRIRIFSAQCPVTSDSPITDFGAVQADDSEREIRAALTTDRDAEVRGQAVFWLAQSDTDEAFEYVERLLTEN